MEEKPDMENDEVVDIDAADGAEQTGVIDAEKSAGDADEAVEKADEDAAGPCDGKEGPGKKKPRWPLIAGGAVAAIAVGCLAWMLSTQPLAPSGSAGSGSVQLGSAPVEQEKTPASDLVRVAVKLHADGWDPSAGAFTLAVAGMDGHEVSRLAVMPEGNGGMAARDAIELLPGAQFDSVRGSYTGEGVDGVSDEPVLELAAGEYEVEVVDAPVLADGSVYRLPGKVKLKVDGDHDAVIELTLEKVDPADGEAVESAIESLPEGKRDEAREQQRQNQQAAAGGSTAQAGGNVGSGPSTGGGSNGGGGSTAPSGGNGGSGSNSGSGQPEKPSRPSHTHVFDIPVTESRWQDGEGYQRVTRIVCNDCGMTFSSWDACSAHITSMVLNDDPRHITGTSTDDSYDTWTKKPGYYDVVVGYKCSCGAMG